MMITRLLAGALAAALTVMPVAAQQAAPLTATPPSYPAIVLGTPRLGPDGTVYMAYGNSWIELLNKAGDNMGPLGVSKLTVGGTGSTGDISQMGVLTFGNLYSKPTNGYPVPGGAAPLALLLAGTYALGNTNDSHTSYPVTDGTQYPFPTFATTPVTSEVLTSSALYDHIVDNPNEANRVFAHSWTYETRTGGTKAVGDFTGERVNTYFGTRGYPGAGSIWALNSQTHLYPGYTGPGAAGYEIDVTNQAQARGNHFGEVNPNAEMNSVGLAIDSSSYFINATAAFVAGTLSTDGSPAWVRGWICSNSSISVSVGACFVDYSSSYAAFQIYAAHQFIIDATNASTNVATIGSVLGTTAGWNIYDGNHAIHTQLYDDGSNFRITRSIAAPSITVNSITAFSATSLFGYLGYADPAPGVNYDAKFGGTGTGNGGIAVNGPSVFNSTIAAKTYLEALATPPSSSASCSAGQFQDDANYHYVCVATNTWKRVALSSF